MEQRFIAELEVAALAGTSTHPVVAEMNGQAASGRRPA
jgi:hypothetical protein